MPRASKNTKPKLHHESLYAQLLKDKAMHQSRNRAQGKRTDKTETKVEEYLDPRSSKRLLSLAKDQQDELYAEELHSDSGESAQPKYRLQPDPEDDDEDLLPVVNEFSWEDQLEELQISPEDFDSLSKLHPPAASERRVLSDMIFSKLNHATIPSKPSPDDPASGVDTRVVQMFEQAGQAMRGTGQLPKVVKMIHSLPEWKRYLAIMAPRDWSPFACRKAVNIFVSNMKSEQMEFFLRCVLLANIREDLARNDKLNVHYYEALIRSIYKPAAFFKGVVFPLLDEACTLREAVIVASVLKKTSIPPTHLGAAIVKIADHNYTGARAIFLRHLIDKKTALPYQVLDQLVLHFIRVANIHRKGDPLPVLFHQYLLVFVQRYSRDLSQEQRDAILDVVKVQFHHQIGPEVRRELAQATLNI